MRSVSNRTVCLSVIRFTKQQSIYRDTETSHLLKTDTSDFSVVKCTELKGLRGVYPKSQTDSHPLNTRAISSRDKTLFQVWLKALHLGSPAPGRILNLTTQCGPAPVFMPRRGARIPSTYPKSSTAREVRSAEHKAQSTKHKAHCGPVHVSARSEPAFCKGALRGPKFQLTERSEGPSST